MELANLFHHLPAVMFGVVCPEIGFCECGLALLELPSEFVLERDGTLVHAADFG